MRPQERGAWAYEWPRHDWWHLPRSVRRRVVAHGVLGSLVEENNGAAAVAWSVFRPNRAARRRR